jgi:hypothetical protein
MAKPPADGNRVHASGNQLARMGVAESVQAYCRRRSVYHQYQAIITIRCERMRRCRGGVTGAAFGCSIDVLRKALLRDPRGVASSPLGIALDSLADKEVAP